MSKKKPQQNNGRHIELHISDEIKITDEMSIVKKARDDALEDQKQTFDYLSDKLVPQLDFKAPIVALDTLKESIVKLQQFNESLAAFRNIFASYADAIQGFADLSRKTNEAFRTAFVITKRFDEMLKTPFLLPVSSDQSVTIEPQTDIERELRQEIVELRSELAKWQTLVEQPAQPLLPAVSSKSSASYDKGTKTISFGGASIRIDTTARSGNQVDLCDLLFKNKANRERGVSNKDIFESWGDYNVDVHFIRKNWRRIYQTAERINAKVSAKTFAPKFIECDTYRTKINKLYL